MLYRRYGIKSVTMDDVASHLGISKKTLYEHFQDKEDIVMQVLNLQYEQRCAMMESVIGQNLDAVAEMFGIFSRVREMFRENNPSMEYDVRKYYPDLYNRFRKMHREWMCSLIQSNLEKGKKDGLYRRELNIGIISRLFVSRIEITPENDLFSAEEIMSKEVLYEVFVYHLFGILSDKGRKAFKTGLATYFSGLV